MQFFSPLPEYYLYISAAQQEEDEVAKLWSPGMHIPYDTGSMCFEFYYHMDGGDIGELRLVRVDQTGEENEIFSRNSRFFLICLQCVSLPFPISTK